MINPDLVGCLNANSVAWSEHFLNVDVPDDNVVFVQDAESDTDECFKERSMSLEFLKVIL